MQFLSENHLNGHKIFGRFGFYKSNSELIFGFPRTTNCNVQRSGGLHADRADGPANHHTLGIQSRLKLTERHQL